VSRLVLGGSMFGRASERRVCVGILESNVKAM